MAAPEIAVAYVSVVPSLKGFSRTLRDQVVAPSRGAGQEAAGHIESGFKRAGASMQSVGATMSATVTAPVAALATAVVSTGATFETSMLKVKALSGATGKEFGELEKMAKELGSTTQYSASEAADAMTFLAMAGFSAKDTMTALPGVLNLAAAGAVDLAQAADIASNVLSGYAMETEEIGRLNDILAKTFTSTNVDLRMLGESFKYVGPVASSAGLAIEETSAAIGLLGNAGIQGSEAGTALRGSIARLLSPTNEVTETLQRLGVTVTDSAGDILPLIRIVEQLESAGVKTADMMTIFGLEAGPAMQALVSQGSDALRELTKELETSGGTAEYIAEVQMSGFAGAFAGMKSAVEGLLITVSDAGALDWATQLADRLATLARAASETNPMLFRIGSIALGVAALVGPALVVLGTAVIAIGAAFTFLVSPIGLVIAAAALVAAGFAYLYLKSETVRDAVHDLARAVGGTLVEAWEDFSSLFTTSVLPVLKTLADELVMTVIPPLVELGKMVFEVVGIVGRTVGNTLLPILQSLASILLDTVWPAVQSVAGAITDNFLPIFRALVDFIRDRVAPGLQLLGEKIGDLLAKAQPFISVVVEIARWLLELGAAIVGTVLPVLIRLAGPIFSALVSALGFAIDVLGYVFDALGWVVDAAVTLGGWISWLWTSVISPVFNAIVLVAKVLFTAVAVAVLLPLIAIFKLLAYTVQTIWIRAIQPVLRWFMDRLKELWEKYAKPMLQFIGDKVKWLWEKAIKPAFDTLRKHMGYVGDGFKALWKKAIKPSLDFIGDKATWLWEKAIKPAFDFIRSGASKVADAFESAKDDIGEQWAMIKGLAKAPVKFVIRTVYNAGIVPLWNKVADLVGAPKLKPMDISNWHTGGILPGYTPGRDVHLAALSGGEAVMRPEWTRAMGPGYVHAMNAAARTGGVGGVQKAMGGIPGFSRGGVFGSIGNLLGDAIDWAKDTGAGWLKSALEALLKGTLGRMPGASSGVGKMLLDLPKKMVSALVGKASSSEAEGATGSGAWLRPVMGPISARYGQRGSMWSSGYHTGTDFPAIPGTAVRAVTTGVVQGLSHAGPYGTHLRLAHPGGIQSLYAHLSSAAVRAGDSVTRGQRIGGVGSTGNSSGPHLHLEALRNGVRMNPESLFDSGGWLRPGSTLTRNDTGRPEPVLTSNQWRNVATLAGRAESGLQPGDRIILSVDGRTEFAAYVDRRADDRADEAIDRTITHPARKGRRR